MTEASFRFRFLSKCLQILFNTPSLEQRLAKFVFRSMFPLQVAEETWNEKPRAGDLLKRRVDRICASDNAIRYNSYIRKWHALFYVLFAV